MIKFRDLMVKDMEAEIMKNAKSITFFSDMREVTLNVRTILYIKVTSGIAYVHLVSGDILPTRTTITEFESMLDENFIKIKRGCLVSVFAIHNVTETVNLNNGESLHYAERVKPEFVEKLGERRKEIIHGFAENDKFKTIDEYAEHYRSFDAMPFAFTDIEMIFDETHHAVDWVFRYGNPALAELEGVPLKDLVGSSFGTIFPNMDQKWLRTYERAALFEEMLNIVDYSPEIGANLSITCFPTFKGHCGCILLDVDKMKFFRQPSETDNAIAAYITKMLG